ncbi:hypothetical protein AB0A77_28530 [Streptomyces varsoviensis]|uniref:hypothetical protein n=1 Tax=Streptomyces varsoviensis TaxID=67373 RepID=UPI0033F92CC8
MADQQMLRVRVAVRVIVAAWAAHRGPEDAATVAARALEHAGLLRSPESAVEVEPQITAARAETPTGRTKQISQAADRLRELLAPRHSFVPERLGASEAKRRLARCVTCGRPRTNSVHTDAGKGTRKGEFTRPVAERQLTRANLSEIDDALDRAGVFAKAYWEYVDGRLTVVGLRIGDGRPDRIVARFGDTIVRHSDGTHTVRHSDGTMPADACGRCGHEFDADDVTSDGHARYGATRFCHWCVANCHESTDPFHRCPVCYSPAEAGECP